MPMADDRSSTRPHSLRPARRQAEMMGKGRGLTVKLGRKPGRDEEFEAFSQWLNEEFEGELRIARA